MVVWTWSLSPFPTPELGSWRWRLGNLVLEFHITQKWIKFLTGGFVHLPPHVCFQIANNLGVAHMVRSIYLVRNLIKQDKNLTRQLMWPFYIILIGHVLMEFFEPVYRLNIFLDILGLWLLFWDLKETAGYCYFVTSLALYGNMNSEDQVNTSSDDLSHKTILQLRLSQTTIRSAEDWIKSWR